MSAKIAADDMQPAAARWGADEKTGNSNELSFFEQSALRSGVEGGAK